MLHLSLIVREVKQFDDEHVSVIADLLEQKPNDEEKGRIIRIGIPTSDEDIERGIGETVAAALEHLRPCTRTQKPRIAVAMYLTKQMFNDLGRPTWGDTLLIKGRTIRR